MLIVKTDRSRSHLRLRPSIGDGRRRKPEAPKIEIDREMLAWAAGFFDGEGTTLGSGPRRYPGLSIHQSGTLTEPPEVLARFHAVFGGLGYVSGPEFDTTGRHKPRWTYHLHGYDYVQVVIALMWRWLGPVKRSQAAAVLLAHRAVPAPVRRPGITRGRPLSAVCKRGHSYEDAYVDPYGRRTCRPCRDQRHRDLWDRMRATRRAATSGSSSDPTEARGQATSEG